MNIEPTSAVFVPVLIGLTEILKLIGLPVRLIPVAVCALGIGLAYYVNMEYPLLNGLVMSLTASGLYSGTKKLLGK